MSCPPGRKQACRRGLTRSRRRQGPVWAFVCPPPAAGRDLWRVTPFWGAPGGCTRLRSQVLAVVCRKFGVGAAVHAEILYLGMSSGSVPGLVALRPRVLRWSLQKATATWLHVIFDPKIRVHPLSAGGHANCYRFLSAQMHVGSFAWSLHEPGCSEILAVERLLRSRGDFSSLVFKSVQPGIQWLGGNNSSESTI